MEVERLTAVLEAGGVVSFTAAMAAADRATGSVSDELRALSVIAQVADQALAGVRVSSAQAAETQAALAAMERSVSAVTATALAASQALDQVQVGPGQAAVTEASTAQMVASLAAVEAAAGDARRSLEGLTAVRAAGGAAGGGGGLLTMLGWGGGANFMGLGGMAAFGSVLGLAGFGLEHVITSIVGVLGSLGGGILGGGLLGLGALGTSAVGMGTDMAGIGQAANDIKQVNTSLTSLNQAIATYGRNSQQAAQAQAQLNTTLASFSPVARGAVLAAAQTAQGFRQMFDQATGQAEKTGAEIINQAMHVGERFLPTIGRFAAQNMGIIQQQLQPLFAWMQNPSFTRPGVGGGLGIFTNLEQVFQRNLPSAVQAGSQAFEFFLRTVDVAAQQTGHLMATLDRFFTHMNQAGPFARWSSEVDKLIALFRTWMGLFGALIHGVFALFMPAVGFGEAFAATLTKVVDQVTAWLRLSSTQATLHGLFDVHLVEVIQGLGGVLQAVLPLLEAAATAFMKIETAAAGLVAGALSAFASLIKEIMRIPFAATLLGWAAAFALIGKANSVLLGGLPVVGSLLRRIGVLPAQVSQNQALTASFTELTAAVDRLVVALGAVGPAAERAAVMTDAAAAQADVGLVTWTRMADGAMVATAGLGTAAVATETEAVGAFAAIKASVLGLLGPLAAAAAAVYVLDKAIAGLTGFDALRKVWGSAGWFADNTAGDVLRGKNPYPVGTALYAEWQAGFMGQPPPHHDHAGLVAGERNPAYLAGERARARAHTANAAASSSSFAQRYATPGALPKVTGNLTGAGAGAAGLSLLPTGMQTALLNAQTQAALAGVTGSVTGGLSPRQVAALDQLLAAEKQALAYLDRQHATGQALVQLDQQRLQLAQAIAQTQQQLAQGRGATGYVTGTGGFQVPLPIQLEQARLAALAAATPGAGLTQQQIRLAEQVKAAVMKAINSHRLTMQGLIDAWNEIATINQQLAQSRGTIDTYHTVSTDAITDAVKGLTSAQELQLQERMAQAAAHRGYVPNGPAILGEPTTPQNPARRGHQSHPLYTGPPGGLPHPVPAGTTINVDTLILEGVHTSDQLAAELDKKTRHRQARRGVRR